MVVIVEYMIKINPIILCEENNKFTFASMKTRFHIFVRKFIAVAMVTFVALLAVNNSVFQHFHRLPDGQIVAHAHPFTKNTNPDSPFQSHKHTQFEFYFFNNVSLLFVVGLLLLALVEFIRKANIQPFLHNVFFSNTPQKLTNKAPPVLI